MSKRNLLKKIRRTTDELLLVTKIQCDNLNSYYQGEYSNGTPRTVDAVKYASHWSLSKLLQTIRTKFDCKSIVPIITSVVSFSLKNAFNKKD